MLDTNLYLHLITRAKRFLLLKHAEKAYVIRFNF